jgi:plastocyanin
LITVVVVAPVLATVTINAPATSMAVSGTIQLTATTKDQNGAAIAATVTWSSSASGIASVGSTTGLVTGVAAGSATITASATAGGVTVTSNVQITITPPPPVLASVTIGAASSSVTVNGTLQFTASPKDQNGSAIAATLNWNSSVPAMATISNSGLVTGVAAGTTNITVSATAGGVTKGSAPTVVTVTTVSFSNSATVNATLGLTFSPSSVDITAGGFVTWNFATTHNVTFNVVAGAPADIPDTSSGSAAATFSIAGTFNYRCTLHPGMTGVVIVH